MNDGMMMFSAADSITADKCSPNVFRVNARAGMQSAALADWMEFLVRLATSARNHSDLLPGTDPEGLAFELHAFAEIGHFGLEFGDAVFYVVDDLIPSFLFGEEPAKAFHILLQYVVGCFLDGNHPALEVYINYLFHFS